VRGHKKKGGPEKNEKETIGEPSKKGTSYLRSGRNLPEERQKKERNTPKVRGDYRSMKRLDLQKGYIILPPEGGKKKKGGPIRKKEETFSKKDPIWGAGLGEEGGDPHLW